MLGKRPRLKLAIPRLKRPALPAHDSEPAKQKTATVITQKKIPNNEDRPVMPSTVTKRRKKKNTQIYTPATTTRTEGTRSVIGPENTCSSAQPDGSLTPVHSNHTVTDEPKQEEFDEITEKIKKYSAATIRDFFRMFLFSFLPIMRTFEQN